MVAQAASRISGAGPLACWEVFFGNALEFCPAESIHCVSSSPSYFKQRKYKPPDPNIDAGGKVEFEDEYEGSLFELGREYSIAEYLDKLESGFYVIRPKLHKTATLWINLKNPRREGRLVDVTGRFIERMEHIGYILVARIIWHKPSPAMEFCPRRPINAYEEILLFANTGAYFYNEMAIRNGNRGIFDVWEIPKAYNEPKSTRTKHPARQNPEVARRCIMLGTSEKGVCPVCKSPWFPKVEKGEPDPEWQKACGGNAQGEYNGQGASKIQGENTASDIKRRMLANLGHKSISGWVPSCKCGLDVSVPALVYDPFCGSGTTLMEAGRLGRDSVGVELYEEWAPDIQRRVQWGYDGAQEDLEDQALLFQNQE